jgi:hypothetical protein
MLPLPDADLDEPTEAVMPPGIAIVTLQKRGFVGCAQGRGEARPNRSRDDPTAVRVPPIESAEGAPHVVERVAVHPVNDPALLPCWRRPRQRS